MNVLSLFDGMSCLQIALKELNVSVSKYYASEIDKYAIKQTQHNFPDTIQLGSVTEWKTWDINWSKIDFIGAGSPCQGFSFAGKQLAFDDPRSKLFFVFIDILNHCRKHNPDVLFLLENVDMQKKHMAVICEYTGVFPVNINSSLVSAQNRSRWYWSNIRTRKEGFFDEVHTDIPQPKDRGILLRDILENDVDEKYYLSERGLTVIIEHKNRQTENKNGFGVQFIDSNSNKSNTLLQRYYKDCKDNAVCVAMRGRNIENTSDIKTGSPTEQRLEPKFDGKKNCLTSVQKDNLVLIGGVKNGQFKEGKSGDFSQAERVYSTESKSKTVNTLGGGMSAKTGLFLILPEATKKGFTEIYPGDCFDFENPNSNTRRGRNMSTKSNSLMSQSMSFMNYTNESRIRRLTPTECANLQTIPTWYKWIVSDSQIYRMLGNGWTIETIKHILSFLKNI